MAYSFQSRTVALQLEDGQTRRLIWGEFIVHTHTTTNTTRHIQEGIISSFNTQWIGRGKSDFMYLSGVGSDPRIN
jgi:hypothetical protein